MTDTAVSSLKEQFLECLAEDPVIASAKDAKSLGEILRSDRQVIFLLFGSLMSVGLTVQRLKDAGKTVLVDIDLLDGLAAKESAVEWLGKETAIDGILSTKANLIRAAKKAGLLTVQRFFLIDSFSYHQLPRVVSQAQPDAIEILPGCIPRVITWLRQDITTPIIAGGLVCDKADVMAALGAGATAVASSNRDVWGM